MAQTYTTKEIADIIGIHPNTVRFYEDVGFLTKPQRLPNGYRVYTGLQLEQCRLIRCAMRAEVLQNGLRKKAVEIVKKCAQLRFDDAVSAAGEYGAMIENEIACAKAAAAFVEKRLANTVCPAPGAMTRQEAAAQLGVTGETVRTWERSGLINVKRLPNGYRVYSGEDMERLNIIRTLRCANYSLSSILRLLTGLDKNTRLPVEVILNAPENGEDIISACDRLLISLESTRADACRLKEMLGKMKETFSTLH